LKRTSNHKELFKTSQIELTNNIFLTGRENRLKRRNLIIFGKLQIAELQLLMFDEVTINFSLMFRGEIDSDLFFNFQAEA
jgi:hypothetical protein